MASNVRNYILLGKDAQSKILSGANKLADLVVSTLSPRGANVAYVRLDPYNNPYDYWSIHDGVKIAKEVNLEDEAENIAAQILKEAAQKTVDSVGDGTTLTICLSQAILNQAYQYIGSGINPMSLRVGLEKGLVKLQKELQRQAIPVKNVGEAVMVATISAQDPELGKLVGECIYDMGIDGVVTVEESRSGHTYIDHQDGMQLENGYLNDWFVTNPLRMEAVVENPYLLITDKELNQLADMTDLFNEIHDVGRPLVIISPSIGGEAVDLLVRNKMSGMLPNLPIKAPSFGDNQKAVLADIAALTGARFISADAGYRFKDIMLEDLGQARIVSATNKKSVIIGGKGDAKEVTQRRKVIEKMLKDETDDFTIIKLKERLGKLTNGISVVYAGGSTLIEMKERFERLDDAVHATRTAMKGGIIPGGEIIFLRIREILNDTQAERILYEALEQPFNKIVTNAGQDAGEIRCELKKWKQPNIGYDVVRLQFRDMIAAGIVDPLLVADNALKNAVSVAIALLTTQGLIVPIIPKGLEARK